MTRFAFVLACVLSQVAFAKSLSLNNTKWVNENKSHMILEQDAKGHLSGIFTNFAPGCDVGVPLPLMGTLAGRIIALVVNFPGCSSVGTWDGVVGADGQTIKTMWHLVTQTADSNEWGDTRTGQDIFINH